MISFDNQWHEGCIGLGPKSDLTWKSESGALIQEVIMP